jgi:DNA polymerase III subunit gamma/tau
MPLALARTYRPKQFASVAVQTHVSNTLKGAIARGRVAHGYLLCGPRGTGKTTLARVLAMALNCERRAERTDGEPCGECDSCRRIWSGSASLDVVEIDAASNRGVDDARDLRERAMYAPSGDDRYKVYIVDEAHMLTREAWNALLKVLEEPPPRVVFVFATTEPHKIAQAAAPVLSRLQRFDLKRISPADIRARLTEVLAAERVVADPDALALLARAADGSMRDALSLADQVLALGDASTLTADRVRAVLGLVPEDEYLSILELIAQHRAADVLAVVARLADAGIDFGLLIGGLAEMLRSQLAIALGGEAADVSAQTRAALIARRDALAPADLLRMLSAITELEPRLRKSAQQQLLVETLLIRFALLDRTVAIEDLLRAISDDAGPGRKQSDRQGDRSSSPTASPPTASPPTASPPTPSSVAASHIPAPPPAPLTAQSLAQRWGDLVARVRAETQSRLLAVALDAATPVLGPAGEVMLQFADSNEIYPRAIEAGRTELLAALRREFTDVTRVSLGTADAPTAAPPRRMTAEAVKADAVATLRKKDAVLGAAIDALDLELIE